MQEAVRKEFVAKSAGPGDREKLDLNRRFGQRLELLKPIADGRGR
jgi:hypothetical protein